MINERLHPLFYMTTYGSDVYKKQKHVINIFSAEDSNLIVDHNFGLDKNDDYEQVFI
jgi:hypothetical protein